MAVCSPSAGSPRTVRGSLARDIDISTVYERTAHPRGIRSWRRAALRVAFSTILLVAYYAGGTVRAAPVTIGRVVATITLAQNIGPGQLVLDERTERVFVPTASVSFATSWVSMIDLRSGRLLRQTPVGLGVPRLAFDAALDRVFVVGVQSMPNTTGAPATNTMASEILELDGVRGTIVASFQLGGHPSGIDVDTGEHRLFVASGGSRSCTPTRCMVDPSVVTMIDARTLRILAVTTVGDSPQGLRVDNRNGRVYVPTSSGIDVLDAGTGRRLVHIPLSGSVLAIDEPADRVILVDFSGDLLFLDGRTSQVQSVQHPPSMLTYGLPGDTTTVDGQNGHLYYAASARGQSAGRPGSAWLLESEGTTGRVLRRCSIAAHPSALATFPRRGEVVVTDAAASTATVINMAGCHTVASAHVPPTPARIAVGGVAGRLVIESNRARRMPAQDSIISSTAVSIVAF